MYKNIYDLRLHEELDIGFRTTVKRVEGGWLYVIKGFFKGAPHTTTFVPFNNEFQIKEHLNDSTN